MDNEVTDAMSGPSIYVVTYDSGRVVYVEAAFTVEDDADEYVGSHCEANGISPERYEVHKLILDEERQ
jgi:hypothetical protein